MTDADQAVPGWVLALLDAFLDGAGWDTSDPQIPLQVIERISAHHAQRETAEQRIAEIKGRRIASTPDDIDWLVAELERRP